MIGAAVVLSMEDLEGLEETLEILSDPRLMQRVRKATKEIAAGQADELTKEQALALAPTEVTTPFTVRWTPTATPDLRRLPEKIATAVVAFVDGSLASNPQRVGRTLRLDLVGYHAARRGDYRVLHQIEDAEGTVVIVTVDHRSDAYRPR